MCVSGPLQVSGSSDGMVLDFSALKQLLCELHDMWDHGLILEKTDPFLKLDLMDKDFIGLGKVFVLGDAPTAENLANYAFEYLQSRLTHCYGDQVILEWVTFFETPTSSATVSK